MSTPTQIIVAQTPQGYGVSVPAEVIEMKRQALDRAAAIQQVTNAEEQAQAIDAAATLKGLSQTMEKVRKEVKDPFFRAGQAIDKKAKEYVADIDTRTAQIERLIADYQREQEARAEAARREQERKQREAEAAVARERDRLAQLERREQEAKLAAQEASGRKAKAEAARQAQALEDERLQAELDLAEAADDSAQAQTILIEPEAPKATGSSIRHKITYEVTDLDAFYRWNWDRVAKAQHLGRTLPSFARVEINRAEFNQYVNIASEAELDSIPGVVLSRTTSASVRAVSPSLTLQ